MPVHLPLERFERCFVCNLSNNLRLCSRCGEATYCSRECQKSDWAKHGQECGKNEAIDLSTFYPILASMAELSRQMRNQEMHPALMHKVINNVNPGVRPCALPDGSAAKLLILGEKCNYQDHVNTTVWMPEAMSVQTQAKLARRILREGYALQIAMAICVALVHAIYTTTYRKDASGGVKKRVRIRYGSSPIADFGICVGSADVKKQDKLAYWLPNGDILMGQDPNEHYWIYFTTVRGEEVVLDFAMFTFNMCLMVQTTGYLSPERAFMVPYAPVFYRNREMRKNAPQLHKERARMSILRNSVVKNIFDDPNSFGMGFLSEPAIDELVLLAEKFSGRKFTSGEVNMQKMSMGHHCAFLLKEIMEERWKTYPSEVATAIEQDPGECDDLDDKSAAWHKTMQKWKREHKKMRQNSER